MPRPDLPQLLACPDCDGLFTAPEIGENERIVCPRCRANLTSRPTDFVTRGAALSLAATFCFILANAFPFMTMTADYRASDMVLAGSVTGLEQQGFPVLAAMVGIFMLAAPALFLGAMMYVFTPLLKGRRLPGARQICRAMHEARQWNMVEVYLLAVLVSLLKLGKLATLTLGVSFWAFVGLIVCLAGAIATMDQAALWRKLEEAKP